MKRVNYPIILIPQPILDLGKAPTVSVKLEAKEKPTKMVVSPPVFPIFPKRQLLFYNGFLWGLWGVWIIGMTGFFVIGILCLFPWFIIGLCVNTYSCLILLLLWKIRSRSLLLHRTYHQQHGDYVGQMEEFIAQQQKNKDEPNIPILPIDEQGSKRFSQLKELLKSRIEPVGKSDARVGVSEDLFFKILHQYFSPVGRVLQGSEFFVTEKEVYRKSRGRTKSLKKLKIRVTYAADFLLLHNSGLGFDIEIDEPYALIKKTPTHCVDDPKDHRRNQFFLEGGWVVVRFTEQQIVEAPLSCCKVIAKVILDIVGDERVYNQLKLVPELLPSRPWTKQESRTLARRDYRLSYLNRVRNY